MFEKWPEVRKEYLRFYKQYSSKGSTPEDFLGCTNLVNAKNKTILNMFTQLEYGPADKQYVDYGAIFKCFDDLRFEDIRNLAVPKIGAGLAGGDWSIIKNIMIEITQRQGIDLLIYSLK